jgi:hypothetical protein
MIFGVNVKELKMPTINNDFSLISIDGTIILKCSNCGRCLTVSDIDDLFCSCNYEDNESTQLKLDL